MESEGETPGAQRSTKPGLDSSSHSQSPDVFVFSGADIIVL